uniref:DUF433 domain-containing protein n=1 Tax=Candidatus Kentrum sp. FW TaxID=2126338 RepID=A0A450T0L3_9GAMM|nr:MAG: Protein of unknown function (DUF433) [Candidatus Kentron sp. FW]
MKDDTIINIDPEIMSGAPVFRGTRVPIQTFIEHLGSDEDLHNFFDGFPGVSREQVVALADEIKERVLVSA